MPNYRTFLRIK